MQYWLAHWKQHSAANPQCCYFNFQDLNGEKRHNWAGTYKYLLILSCRCEEHWRGNLQHLWHLIRGARSCCRQQERRLTKASVSKHHYKPTCVFCCNSKWTCCSAVLLGSSGAGRGWPRRHSPCPSHREMLVFHGWPNSPQRAGVPLHMDKPRRSMYRWCTFSLKV